MNVLLVCTGQQGRRHPFDPGPPLVTVHGRPGVALSLILLLALLPLAGCVGGSGDENEPLRQQRAEVTEISGGIEGVVTDDAVQPVEGANVTIEETGALTRTASDGSYAFSRVLPGTYTLTVRAPGFVSTQETVSVRADEAAVVDLLLAHLFTQDAYQQTLEIAGFMECGLGWRIPVPEPAPQLVRRSALAACGAVNGLVLENATNDRFIHRLALDPPLDTLVYEMAWPGEAGPLGGTHLWSILDVEPVFNSNGSRIISKKGPSPLHVVVTADQWTELEGNLTTRCDEGEDAWCLNVRDDGWPFLLRVFADSDCVSEVASACVIYQQRFDHVLSAFYNGPAPADYRIFQPL